MPGAMADPNRLSTPWSPDEVTGANVGRCHSQQSRSAAVPLISAAAGPPGSLSAAWMSGSSYRVPSPDQLAERVGAVLDVVHLIFTTGHTAPVGACLLRRDLVDSAIGLARMLHLLMPNDAEVSALLALLLLIDARSATRLSGDGRMLLLSHQDRARWDTGLIAEGVGLLTDALRRRPPATADEVRRGGRDRRRARRGAVVGRHRLEREP